MTAAALVRRVHHYDDLMDSTRNTMAAQASERRQAIRDLIEAAGSQAEAARLLGLSRAAVQKALR